jgi:hypothetical protein
MPYHRSGVRWLDSAFTFEALKKQISHVSCEFYLFEYRHPGVGAAFEGFIAEEIRMLTEKIIQLPSGCL